MVTINLKLYKKPSLDGQIEDIDIEYFEEEYEKQFEN